MSFEMRKGRDFIFLTQIDADYAAFKNVTRRRNDEKKPPNPNGGFGG
jgi:hypothetical protein